MEVQTAINRKRLEKKLRKLFASEGFEPYDIDMQSHNLLSRLHTEEKVSFHLQIRAERKPVKNKKTNI